MQDITGKKGTIVSIGAHYDDVELRSGGTLATYLDAGWHVVYSVATTTPYYNPWPEEVANSKYPTNQEITLLRQEESRKGAASLGITDVHFFNYKSIYWYREGTLNRRYFDGDGLTEEDFAQLQQQMGNEFIVSAARCPAALDRMCNFLLEKKADIVLTHFPDDVHWEHYATPLLVRTAVNKLYKEGHKIDLYAWEQGGEGNLTTSFAPTHFVDITNAIDRKCESLLHFVSQFADHDTTFFAERARKKAAFYGKLAGYEYAEPFMKFQIPQVDNREVALPVTYDHTKAAKSLDITP